MAIAISGTMEPAGNFPAAMAKDIEMPDGTRLDEYQPDVVLTSEQIAALKGDKGDPGTAGADGKSAYQYAQEAGYQGTEQEFAAKLAAGGVSDDHIKDLIDEYISSALEGDY